MSAVNGVHGEVMGICFCQMAQLPGGKIKGVLTFLGKV
jgi:hypothetical protein